MSTLPDIASFCRAAPTVQRSQDPNVLASGLRLSDEVGSARRRHSNKSQRRVVIGGAVVRGHSFRRTVAPPFIWSCLYCGKEFNKSSNVTAAMDAHCPGSAAVRSGSRNPSHLTRSAVALSRAGRGGTHNMNLRTFPYMCRLCGAITDVKAEAVAMSRSFCSGSGTSATPASTSQNLSASAGVTEA